MLDVNKVLLERMQDLIDTDKVTLKKMVATSDENEKSINYYKNWTKGELVIYLLEHYWPDD